MPEPVERLPSARFASLPSWLITQTAHYVQRLVADSLGAVGARGYHYRALVSLNDDGPASQADLGRRSGIHLSDLVATLNELADEALVERVSDPADRRRNIITITAAGRRRLRRLEKQVAGVQDELLAPLSAAEREELTRLLYRVLEHQITSGSGHQPPSMPEA